MAQSEGLGWQLRWIRKIQLPEAISQDLGR